MSISFDKALGIHEQALSFRAQRAEVLANNIANADTPNYKARDLDFSKVLADGVLLGVTGGTTIAPVSPELVYVGQGYLPHTVGTGLGILLFALTLFLTWKQRRNRALHGLAAHSLVRDVLRVVVIGAVLAGFVYTLNSYEIGRAHV